MPVITFASPKGGVGKTTAALILATEIAQELAKKGEGVTVIDADPEQHIVNWSKKGSAPKNLYVIAEPSEKSIVDDIEKAQEKTPFTIIDLEGTANVLVSYGMAHSDLVIVPVQPSSLDAAGAAKALLLVKQQEKAFKRRIPHAILLNSTKAAYRTRALGTIEHELEKAGVTVFQTNLIEREAFRQIFAQGKVLEDLKNQHNLEVAIANARAYASEVITMLENSASDETTEQKVRAHG